MCDFIKTRLNKDNFWNLMFFVTFFSELTIGHITPQPFGGVIFWFAIVCAILLVKKNSHITFDKEKSEFTTTQGNKIKKAGLAYIFLLIISFFLSAVIVALITEWFDSEYLTLLLFAFFFTLLPSLYCIVQNFPIAVYFKKEAWTAEGNAGACDSSDDWRSRSHHSSSSSGYNWRSRSHHSSSSSRYDWRGSSHNSSRNSHNRESLITSPRHRYLSCNLYHR